MGENVFVPVGQVNKAWILRKYAPVNKNTIVIIFMYFKLTNLAAYGSVASVSLLVCVLANSHVQFLVNPLDFSTEQSK